jgi:hypothetical protein
LGKKEATDFKFPFLICSSASDGFFEASPAKLAVLKENPASDARSSFRGRHQGCQMVFSNQKFQFG